MDTITFVCHAPQGTLGDPSAAIKAIQAFGEKHPGVNTHLIIKSEASHHELVKSIIPPDIKYSITDKALNSSDEINKLLENSKSIVIYPTAHFLAQSEYKAIKQFQVPILLLTEYNSDMGYSQRTAERHEWPEDDFPPISALYRKTGVSPSNEHNNLGVFFSSSEKKMKKLSELSSKQAQSFTKFLYELQEVNKDELMLGPEENYQSSHDLYLGYYNNLQSESKKKGINCKMFFDICVGKSQNAINATEVKKTIDIVMPLKESSELMKPKDFFKQMFPSEKYKSTECTISYYEKNEKGDMVCTHAFGEGAQKIRIINGFPFSPDAFSALMKMSDPICLLTGDQSFFEGLEQEKLPLYQAMMWKVSLLTEFTERVKTELGAASALYQFYNLQLEDKKSPETKVTAITQLVTKKKNKLIDEMKRFRSILYEKDNLNTRLPELVYNFTFDDTNRAMMMRLQARERGDSIIKLIKEDAYSLNQKHTVEKYDACMRNIELYSDILYEKGFDIVKYSINNRIKPLYEALHQKKMVSDEMKKHWAISQQVSELNDVLLKKTPYLFCFSYRISKARQAELVIESCSYYSKQEDCTLYYNLGNSFQSILESLHHLGLTEITEEQIKKLYNDQNTEGHSEYYESKFSIDITHALNLIASQQVQPVAMHLDTTYQKKECIPLKGSHQTKSTRKHKFIDSNKKSEPFIPLHPPIASGVKRKDHSHEKNFQITAPPNQKKPRK